MELENEFTVPVPVDEAWQVMLDVERVARCMPGATLDSSEGDTHHGHVKVKVGPISVTYRGTATFVERDEASRRVVIEASGKELRGSGTARATITTTLADRGSEAGVHVRTDLAITGRPAQFGRGVMADVSTALVKQFAQALAVEVTGSGSAASAPPASAPPATAGSDPAPGAGTVPGSSGNGNGSSAGSSASLTAVDAPPEARGTPPAPSPAAEAEIDLLRAAGLPIAKRALPVLGVVLLLVLLVRRLTR